VLTPRRHAGPTHERRPTNNEDAVNQTQFSVREGQQDGDLTRVRTATSSWRASDPSVRIEVLRDMLDQEAARHDLLSLDPSLTQAERTKHKNAGQYWNDKVRNLRPDDKAQISALEEELTATWLS
jgi:hypothetical protein